MKKSIYAWFWEAFGVTCDIDDLSPSLKTDMLNELKKGKTLKFKVNGSPVSLKMIDDKVEVTKE